MWPWSCRPGRARPLTGKSRAWSERELARYSSSQAVAITIYSHIFNTNPAFSDAQAVLFDDAHAAENYVAEAWALQIGHDHVAYAHLLPDGRVQRHHLEESRGDPAGPDRRLDDQAQQFPVQHQVPARHGVRGRTGIYPLIEGRADRIVVPPRTGQLRPRKEPETPQTKIALSKGCRNTV
jgi:hypothetical protein